MWQVGLLSLKPELYVFVPAGMWRIIAGHCIENFGRAVYGWGHCASELMDMQIGTNGN